MKQLKNISLLGMNRVISNCGEYCRELERCGVMGKKGENIFKQTGVTSWVMSHLYKIKTDKCLLDLIPNFWYMSFGN